MSCGKQLLLVYALLVVLWATPGNAGPLDPPTGPVAATGRTQILTYPYVINTPGSYVLARDISGDPGTPQSVAITINASQVTLDLNGFSIRGGRIQSFPAISLASNLNTVVIKNGRISGFGGQWTGGILGADAQRCRVEDVVVDNYAGGTVAERVGIKLGRGSVVTRCDVSSSDGRGIELGSDSLVTDCTCYNHSNGSIFVGTRSIVRNCACSASGGPGSTISISTGAGSIVEGCTFGPANFISGTAVSVGDSSIIRTCAVAEVAGSNPIKFIGAVNCLIADCSLRNSTITVGSGSRVVNCTLGSTSQADALITTQARCTVSQCTLSGGFEAINATGPGTLIDGNTIGGTPTGVSLVGTGTRVIRNSFNGCATPISNPSGVPANDVAPVGTAAAAVSPWANLVN